MDELYSIMKKVISGKPEFSIKKYGDRVTLTYENGEEWGEFSVGISSVKNGMQKAGNLTNKGIVKAEPKGRGIGKKLTAIVIETAKRMKRGLYIKAVHINGPKVFKVRAPTPPMIHIVKKLAPNAIAKRTNIPKARKMWAVYAQIRVPTPKTASPKKNYKGRQIHFGPRGGSYVLINGKKVYKVRFDDVNFHGRKVHTGPRGGKYVIIGTKKVYS